MRTLSILSIFFIFSVFSSRAQLGVGEWRDHFSFKDCHSIVSYNGSIYAASTSGLIQYDIEDGSISKLSKSNCISDIGISTIGSDGLKNLIIGYENGNIDILDGTDVFNMRDVVMLPSNNNKRINNIYFFGKYVYLASDLGILVLNIAKKEVADSYYLSANSTTNPVYQVAIVDSVIYAATSTGIYSSPLSNPLIKVFGSWKLFSKNQSVYCDIQPFNGSIIAAKGIRNQNCAILKYTNGEESTLFNSPNFSDLSLSKELYVTDFNSIKVFDTSFITVKTKVNDAQGFLTAVNLNDVTYIGRNGGGLYVYTDFINHDELFEEILPNGPNTNLTYDLKSSSFGLWSTPGGTQSSWNNLFIEPNYSFYDGTEWFSFTSKKVETFLGEWDLLKIAINPKNPTDIAFSSWGSGIYKILENDSVLHYDQHNSALRNIFEADNNYVRVGGVAIDKNGVTWMNNAGNSSGGILALTPDKTWYNFDYNFAKSQHSQGMILITKNGFKWSFFPFLNQGLFVWDDNTTLENMNDDRYRSPESSALGLDSRNSGELRLWDKNGDIITNVVVCLAEDKDGVLWIGTDKGPVLYYRPSAIFDESKPIASRINIPRNDGSGLGDYLLADQTITAIAIDPANRKWVGTSSSGLYLLSSDGTSEIAHFTVQNSALPSNGITAINVVEATGEVFVGTLAGLVSYRSTAIMPAKDYNNLIVFPNPVPKNYDGLITVTGLTEESNVKIVDVMGNLVYELTSLGGEVVWNGNGFNGERVKSGVYYFLLLSSDGTLNGKAKVMIIN